MEKPKLSFHTSAFDHFFDSDAIVSPKRDWDFLLIFFVVMLVGSFVFDAFIYTQIITGDMYINVNKDELTIQTLKSNQLQNIITDFQSRQAAVTNLKPERSIDPSL